MATVTKLLGETHCASVPFPSSLTPEQFVLSLRSKLARGESKKSIGCALGVSEEAVRQWLTGRCGVSRTVLILAELLWRGPRELPAGLPVDDQSQAG